MSASKCTLLSVCLGDISVRMALREGASLRPYLPNSGKPSQRGGFTKVHGFRGGSVNENAQNETTSPPFTSQPRTILYALVRKPFVST
jgi:hypothetical protein